MERIDQYSLVTPVGEFVVAMMFLGSAVLVGYIIFFAISEGLRVLKKKFW